MLQSLDCSIVGNIRSAKHIMTLEKYALFRSLHPLGINKLLPYVKRIYLNRDHLVYDQGDFPQKIFLLKRGCIDF